MIMEAYDHPDFQEIVNSADLVTPDGMPLVWCLRAKGEKAQERVYGPTLMLEVLRMAEKEGLLVGFLGSAAEILQELSIRMLCKYPGLKIAVSVPLPFREMGYDEDLALCEEIEKAGVQILFVALGCPKQERWIAAHRGRVPTVTIGVGAAFAFHAGVVKQAQPWMQKLGLEWLFRLTREPRRLWKRYLWNNPRFMVLVVRELFCEKVIKKGAITD
jgi:N-acetylglucosaminyldiphosphoundecaprenol N-acetyl-beta-D-mannosaminyltransferase